MNCASRWSFTKNQSLRRQSASIKRKVFNFLPSNFFSQVNSRIQNRKNGFNTPYKAVNLDEAMFIFTFCGFYLLYVYKLSVPLNE